MAAAADDFPRNEADSAAIIIYQRGRYLQRLYLYMYNRLLKPLSMKKKPFNFSILNSQFSRQAKGGQSRKRKRDR